MMPPLCCLTFVLFPIHEGCFFKRLFLKILFIIVCEVLWKMWLRDRQRIIMLNNLLFKIFGANVKNNGMYVVKWLMRLHLLQVSPDTLSVQWIIVSSCCADAVADGALYLHA